MRPVIGKTVTSVILYLNIAGAVLGGTALIGIIVMSATEVVMRGVFRMPFVDVVLSGRIAMLVMGFGAAGYAMQKSRHITITFVSDRLPPATKRWTTIVALSFCLVALALAVVICFRFALLKYEVGEYVFADWHVKSWPLQMVIPIGLAILSLELARQLLTEIQNVMGGSPDSRNRDETG